MESFNSRLRDDLSNGTVFPSLRHPRATLGAWRTDDRTERPYARRGWQTPVADPQTFPPQRARGWAFRKVPRLPPPHNMPKPGQIRPGALLRLDKRRGNLRH
ncbi:integrase core domain-containing protein [Paracoccus spongiarum]|uniref:integrase core domain-containing protein n=1 Tax=Paracoccus spongiarum TaxID=3064387 RepID=UPI0035323AA4